MVSLVSSKFCDQVSAYIYMGTFLCLKICHEPKDNSMELSQKDNLTISSCLHKSDQVIEISGQALPSPGMKPRQLLLIEQLEERREEGKGADLKVGGMLLANLPDPRAVLNGLTGTGLTSGQTSYPQSTSLQAVGATLLCPTIAKPPPYHKDRRVLQGLNVCQPSAVRCWLFNY